MTCRKESLQLGQDNLVGRAILNGKLPVLQLVHLHVNYFQHKVCYQTEGQLIFCVRFQGKVLNK